MNTIEYFIFKLHLGPLYLIYNLRNELTTYMLIYNIRFRIMQNKNQNWNRLEKKNTYMRNITFISTIQIHVETRTQKIRVHAYYRNTILNRF